jgi:hypothetical protein
VSFEDIIKVSAASLFSIGTASAIIFGLSSFLGKIWANRIMENEKQEHKKELAILTNMYTTQLEDIKSKYGKELEVFKTELEKSKYKAIRYSQNQFLLYTQIWESLYDLKVCTANLWNMIDETSFKEFVTQFEKTKNQVVKNRLIIEETDYDKLQKLFSQLDDYKCGKRRLLDFENQTMPGDIDFMRNIVANNQEIVLEYNNIIESICRSFRYQLSGK